MVVLDNIGMVLYFSELLSFFFEFIELIQCLGLDFLQCVELASGTVHCLVYFSVLLARA
jgi:hypothetical protein